MIKHKINYSGNNEMVSTDSVIKSLEWWYKHRNLSPGKLFDLPEFNNTRLYQEWLSFFAKANSKDVDMVFKDWLLKRFFIEKCVEFDKKKKK